MPRMQLTERDLHRELTSLYEQNPRLSSDEVFLAWFMRAFITEDDRAALAALCGGANDGGIDAVLTDERARTLFIMQGKHRKELGKSAEKRSDIVAFARLAGEIVGDGASFPMLVKSLSPQVADRLSEARRRVLKDGFRMQLFYVTAGRCSQQLEEEGRRIVRNSGTEAAFEVFDGRQLLLLLSDYLDGVAPPVPSLELEIEAGQRVGGQNVLQRFDRTTGIESWVFSMTDMAVADLFNSVGTRLFARNVRGYLGSTDINRGMAETLIGEPEHFWYYNNGVTIVCDGAEGVRSRGREILRVSNPQVINGQQTTRTLAANQTGRSRASVLVRVIAVPRTSRDTVDRFETLVSRIVQATNWQNQIAPSDLMANDRRQIEIEREFRKAGYWYMRKRQTRGEARRVAGRNYHLVKKEAIAKSSAACEMDPAIVREGKERLFEESRYLQVFPNADPAFYLPRYFLAEQVGLTAAGYPERAYAKWVVLHFAWRRLAPLVRNRSGYERMRSAWDANETGFFVALNAALNIIHRAALRFYRAKRGKGPRAQDPSTFFQRRGLHHEFERFWVSGANSFKRDFGRRWGRFKSRFENRPRDV